MYVNLYGEKEGFIIIYKRSMFLMMEKCHVWVTSGLHIAKAREIGI